MADVDAAMDRFAARAVLASLVLLLLLPFVAAFGWWGIPLGVAVAAAMVVGPWFFVPVPR